MRWPWSKPETRQSAPYSDAVIAGIIAAAGGSTPGDPSAIAALETAAGLWSRAFMAAKVSPEDSSLSAAISPGCLAMVGRELCRRGECVFVLSVEDGRVRFIPAASWDVRGSFDERGWWYRCDLFGPSGNITRFVPSAAVLHFRYAVDPARPWFGLGPLQWARDSATLAANLERRTGEEAGAPVGSLLPIPQDGGDGGTDDPLAALKADIRTARGRHLLVETTSSGWAEGKSAAPMVDWQVRRFGAAPPAPLVALRSDAAMSVLSACGVPVSLAADADGTAARESWRRYVLGTAEPILNGVVRSELSEKLGVPDLRFDLTGLWAHDGAGRAAMFDKLVRGGVGIDDALRRSGLMAGE